MALGLSGTQETWVLNVLYWEDMGNTVSESSYIIWWHDFKNRKRFLGRYVFVYVIMFLRAHTIYLAFALIYVISWISHNMEWSSQVIKAFKLKSGKKMLYTGTFLLLKREQFFSIIIKARGDWLVTLVTPLSLSCHCNNLLRQS